MSATDSAAASAETSTDTIAARTRTKFSLVDVPIDTLEASLPLDHIHATTETAEDREYQRFLSSLLPNEQVNLSFLDEEDEEYRPEEEEEEHEDEEARRGISKKELTDLLLDSTHMSFSSLPAGTLEPNKDDMLLVSDNHNDDVLSIAVSGEKKDLSTAVKPGKVTGNMAVQLPVGLRGRPVAVSQAQCIQLTSQMHKHLQLLLQSYHLLTSRPVSTELAECRAMIEELQQRGEKALKYKNTLLSKLNSGATGGGGGSTTGVVDADAGGNKTSSVSDLPRAEGVSSNAMTTEDLLALRRVTRSLTAAHAAVAHPSMFELVGSQTVDELSAGFARGCSLDERDRAIKEQMLQLDTHLLSAKKSRKSKKGYSTTEDTLLAHGAKRFGTQAYSWDQIRKHFLPTKTTQNLRHRYKYLISPKTGMSAVKALHLRVAPQHHNNSWLLEEDLRIARGLVELHKEKYPFSRLSKSYLPHRSRLEIRKRWERLAVKFRSDLAEIGLTAPDDDSLDLVVAMKEYLEDKLRNRMMRQQGESEKAKLEAALQLHQLGQGRRKTSMPQSDRNESVPSLGPDIQKKGTEASSCRSKNLHPALFFSSWSFISPATLLNATCKHNWPSFMDEDNDADDKLQKNQPSADVADNGVLESDSQYIGANDQAVAFEIVQTQEFMPIAMPSDLVVTPTSTDTGQFQASVSIDARMTQKESEGEDDDSDYEHDELLSSDNEESESDFEQMEFTDDDDEVSANGDYEASADSFDQDHILSDSDNQSAASANSLKTPSRSLLSSPSCGSWGTKDAPSDSNMPSPRFRHPLRLQNLGQPGNERMKRALAALERRIIGKSIKSSASCTSTPSSQTGLLDKRAKRRVVSTPLGANQTSNSVSQVDVDEHEHVVTAKTGSDANDDDYGDDDWENGSGDEEFEVVELPSSSDEFSATEDEAALSEPVTAKPAQELCPSSNQTLLAATTSHSEASGTSPNNTLPNKKAKIQECPTCVHTTCTCSSRDRMQLLLRRMKEKHSSSSMQ